MSLTVGFSYSQDRFSTIETRLGEVAKTTPGLNEKIELSVNGASLQEFIRGLATSNSINVSVDPGINVKIANNFSNVSVAEVFLFLCKKYDLEITFVGPIMSFVQYVPPAVITVKPVAKQRVFYNKQNDELTLDFNRDSIASIAKEITKVSGKNVVFSPELNGRMVSGYIQNISFAHALEKFAFANDFKVTATEDDFYLLEKAVKEMDEQPGAANNKKNKKNSKQGNNYSSAPGLNIKVNDDLITIDATNTPIADVLGAVSGELKKEYFFFSEVKGNTTLNVNSVNYDTFLKLLFNTTDFTFKKVGEIYLIGDRNQEGLRSTKNVQLKYRTVDKVIDYIPADLKKGVDIKPFPDLNSLILSGSQPRIDEIEAFLKQIDKVVPVIQIEVIIADVSDTKTLSTGIEAGLGTSKKTTQGIIYPGVDMTLNSESINSIISGLTFGSVNLGSVTPNFYITLKALEQQGVLKLRSTPKIATLNGHEAKLSIGKTEYYLEVSNNVIGSQNPQNIITQQYKSVNADLSVDINPSVSGDEQITLEINVKQSSFTARISPSAPPGTISRTFQSMIRVKNEEMIMLGGLEETSMNDAGSGVPFLSRIPVIKWFFSSRTKAKSKNKLTIFIKPTVLY